MDEQNARRSLMLKGGLLILVGLAFLIWPGQIISGIAFYIGLVLLAIGLASFYYTYQANKGMELRIWSYTAPIVSTVGGLILIIFPQYTLSIFAFAAGIYVLYEGVSQIRLSGAMENVSPRSGNYMLVIGVVSIVIGVLIVLRPFDFVKALTILFGFVMLVAGGFMFASGMRRP